MKTNNYEIQIIDKTLTYDELIKQVDNNYSLLMDRCTITDVPKNVSVFTVYTYGTGKIHTSIAELMLKVNTTLAFNYLKFFGIAITKYNGIDIFHRKGSVSFKYIHFIWEK
jgi:hypothetical protein